MRTLLIIILIIILVGGGFGFYTRGRGGRRGGL